MGSIDIIKPLATAPSTINLSSIKRECRESNPGLLGEKQVCYLHAIQTTPFVIKISEQKSSEQDQHASCHQYAYSTTFKVLRALSSPSFQLSHQLVFRLR